MQRIEHATSVEFRIAQSSNEWRTLSIGRLGTSQFLSAIGMSIFATPQQVAEDLRGNREEFAPTPAMMHGILTESQARTWYEGYHGVQVVQTGCFIPKWDSRLKASPDGLIGEDGLLEIKCPKNMYARLSHPSSNFDHIWPSHFAQMQGCMAITNRKWCDYLVFATESNKWFLQRIPFNKKYWDNYLYPKIQEFLDTHAIPTRAIPS